ncbi:MAG: hypothetical protein HKM04_01870 [Legionellales bacterium]|nr:hypothetical protein [Legionellales bacterium]
MMGTTAGIADATQDYFTGMCYGLPAMFWVPIDIQLGLGLKAGKVAPIAGTAYSLMSMAIGYPLALCGYGTKGLGIGSSISAWLTLIGLRIYFTNSKFRPFNLFSYRLKGSLNDYYVLLERGLAMGFQNISEWGSLMAITLIVNSQGAAAALAEEIAIQPITSFNLVLAGLAQGIGVGVAHYLGATNLCKSNNDHENAVLCRNNAQRYGNTGITLSAIAAILAGSSFMLFSKQLINWLGSSEGDASVDEQLAFNLLAINSMGLLFDSIRIVTMTILIGNKDPWFSPLVSFFLASVLPIAIGAILTLYFNTSISWLFITRDIGIACAAAIIGTRWYVKSSNDEKELPKKQVELINEEESGRKMPISYAKNKALFFSANQNKQLTAKKNTLTETLADVEPLTRKSSFSCQIL